MSDTAPGPGWWLATDGRWYPPVMHPSAVVPTPSVSSTASTSLSDGFPPVLGERHENPPWLWIIGTAAVAVLAAVLAVVIAS